MSNETTLTVKSDASEFEMATTSGSLMLAGGKAFEHIQRVAKMFASSDLIPDAFKGKIPNCVIALEMAHRMGANPMAVMQNLYIVHGRPGWSAQFIIACLNQCGKFSPLRFEMTGEGAERQCIAKAKELETGDILEGPAVSIAMAKAEGWMGKNGSKWQTMPELMLRYRAATFFGRLYAPDMLMGMQTAEEIIDVDPPAKLRVVETKPKLFARQEALPEPEPEPEKPAPFAETEAEEARDDSGDVAGEPLDTRALFTRALQESDIGTVTAVAGLKNLKLVRGNMVDLATVPEQVLARCLENWADYMTACGKGGN